MSDDIQALWAEQTTIPLEVDMTKIMQEAGKFERALRRRNALELGAAAIVAVAFSAYAVLFDGLARLGAIGVVAGTGFIVAAILRRGREAPLPQDAPTAEFLAAYRDALLRQARLLTWVPLWYVAPVMVPGLVFAIGVQQLQGRPASPALVAGWILVGLAVSVLNLYGARRLRRQAEALTGT